MKFFGWYEVLSVPIIEWPLADMGILGEMKIQQVP